MSKVIKLIRQHKLISSIIAIALSVGGYYGYVLVFPTASETRYVLAAVEKGTLITSVSGSGQISASNQSEVKAKVSADVVSVPVVKGQEVKANTVLAWLDSGEAQKAVQDAQTDLETAQLALDKLKEPADELSVLQAENSLTQAQESKQKAEDELAKAYEDGYNATTNVFLELPDIMTGLYDVLFESDFSSASQQQNLDFYADAIKKYNESALAYRDLVLTSYQSAHSDYDQNYSDYKSASRFSESDTIESLILETYETTKQIAETIKNANNLIQLYKDEMSEHNLRAQTLADTHLTSLSSYTSKTNSFVSSLLSAKRTIQTQKEAITSATRTIEERTQSLAKLNAEPDALDLRSQQLVIKQRQDALIEAKEKLADYAVRAPFNGIIAELDVVKGDTVSSATVVATIITKQQIAEVSLNEVDAANVEVGQKATLTFDAISDLTISGQVADIDSLGTVSQGVVSYTVKIAFDTQEEQIKPGMTASASIITEAKQNVLLVPNSAIKSLGESYYVETLANASSSQLSASAMSSAGIVSKDLPAQQTIEIGLANDSMTEIISGLNEGDQIVTRTIASSSSQSSSSSSSSGKSGLGGSGMMMMR